MSTNDPFKNYGLLIEEVYTILTQCTLHIVGNTISWSTVLYFVPAQYSKGPSRNDVTFLGGRGVSQKVTKSDRGESAQK